jgi:hypothetical protein
MKLPEIGSKWSGQNNYVVFRILHTIELDGHTWVHYCDNNNGGKEYSCYLDSFLARFTELVS